MAEIAVVGAERTSAAPRKAGRRGGRAPLPPPVYHAVTPRRRTALRAEEPGAGSARAEAPGPEVTCPGRRGRLDRLARGGVSVVVIGSTRR